MKKILLIISLILLTNCSTTTKSHMSSVVGATAGYGTCHHMLNTGVGLTAACTVVGAMIGSSLFFNSLPYPQNMGVFPRRNMYNRVHVNNYH